MGTGKTYSTKYLLDSNNSSGVAGQVLSTTSTGIDWVDANTVPGTGLWLSDGNDIYNSNSGNVGIGTTSPTRLLSISNSDTATTPQLLITQNGAGDAVIGFNRPGHQGWAMGIDSSIGNNFEIHNSSGGVDSSSQLAITPVGNVGIGTTSPSSLLHLESASSPTLQIKDTTNDVTFKAYAQDSNTHLANVSNHDLFIDTNNTARITVKSGGNVGIGTTSPSGKLTVKSSGFGTAYNDYDSIYIDNGDVTAGEDNYGNGIGFSRLGSQTYKKAAIVPVQGTSDTDNLGLAFFTSPSGGFADAVTEAMRVDYNGNVGIGTTSPSSPLHVSSSDNNLATFESTDAISEIRIKDNSKYTRLLTVGSDFKIMPNDGVEMAVFEGDTGNSYFNGGNVGIGTTSPSTKLQISSTMSSTPTSNIFLDVDGSNVNGGGGSIIFNTSASAGTASGYNAKITGTREGGGTGGDSRLGFWTTLVSSSTAPQERMTITKEGNVGIGTTSPSAKLEVNGQTVINSTGLTEGFQWFNDTNEIFSLEDTSGAGELLLLSSNSVKVKLNANGNSYFNGGNVGIGTTSPGAKLNVIGGSGDDIIAKFKTTGTGTGDYSEIHILNDNNDALKIGSIGSNYTNSSWAGMRYVYADSGDLGLKAVAGTGNVRIYAGGAGLERMRIASNGNVGIGTTSPGAKLDVEGRVDFSNDLRLRGTDSSANQGVSRFYVDSSNKLFIDTANNGSNLFVIDSSGNVGIGTTSPGSLLHIKGADPILTIQDTSTGTANASSTLRLGESGAGGVLDVYWDIKQASDDLNTHLEINHSSNGNHFTILDNGNVGIGTTSPSTKLEVAGGADAIARILGTTTAARLDLQTNSYHKFIQIIESDGRFRLYNQTTSLEQLTVLNGGNVGIGTASPASKFEVYGGNTGVNDVDRYIRFKASNGEKRFDFYVGGTGNASILGMYTLDGTTKTVQIAAGGTSYFNAGNVGIGTTAPTTKLNVSGSIAVSSGSYLSFIDSNLNYNKIGRNTSVGGIQITTGGNATMNLLDNGNVGIGATSPGAKLDVNGDVLIKSGEYISWGTVGATSIEGSTASNKLQFRTNSSDRMIIDSAGNVGIGTTSPLDKLHVNGTVRANSPTTSDWAVLGFNSAGNAPSGLWFENGDGELLLRDDSGNLNVRLRSDTNSYINGGSLGLGTTSPNLKLDVISGTNNGIRISATDTTSNWRDIDIRSYVSQAQANALPDGSAIYTTNPTSQTETAFSKFGGLVLQGRDDGNSSFAIRLGSGSGYATRMFMGATGATVFSNTVTATNFILSSDERLKENVEKVCDNRVKADWKTFELKADKGQKRYGVIAQELEKTNPEFVREDSQGFKSVAYIDLLIAKIAELEARLEKLEK